MLLLQLAYALFVEATVCPACLVYPFSPRPVVGKLGTSPTTRRIEAEASSAALCRTRQIVLGDSAAALAEMGMGLGPCPAGDRCSLAQGRIQVVLDMALAASEPRWKKMRQQRIARTYLPYGCRESDLGCAANSWRTEDARLRYLGENRAALDAEGSTQS